MEPTEIAYDVETREKDVQDCVPSHEDEEPVMPGEDDVEQCIEYS